MNYDEIFNNFKSSYIDKEIKKEVILNKLSNTDDKEIISRFVSNAYLKYSVKADSINKKAEKNFEEIQIIEININDYRAIYDIYGILLSIIPYPILAFFRYEGNVSIAASNRELSDDKNNKGKIFVSYLINEEEIEDNLKIDIEKLETMKDLYYQWINNIDNISVYYERIERIINIIEVGFHIKSAETLEKLESYIVKYCYSYNMKPKDGWKSKLEKYSDEKLFEKKIEIHSLWEYLSSNTFLRNKLEDFSSWNDFKEACAYSYKTNNLYYSQYNNSSDDEDVYSKDEDYKTKRNIFSNYNLQTKVEKQKVNVSDKEIINDVDNESPEYEKAREEIDREFLLNAIRIDYNVLLYASDELLSNKDFMLQAVEINGDCVEWASDNLLNDEGFMLEAIKKDVGNFPISSDELLNDKEFILKAIDINFMCMKYVSDEFINNEEFCLKAIEIDVCSLEFIGDDLYKDEEFMLKAIEKNKLAVSYLNERLKNDEEFMRRALEKNELAVGFLGLNLKNNEDFMTDLIRKDYWNARYIGEVLRNNKEFMLKIIKQNIWFILCTSNELIQDEGFILRAIELNSWSVNFIEPGLSNNFEFMLKAIEKNGLSIEYAGDKLQENKEFIQRLLVLLDISKYLTDDVITDKQVIFRAIENNDIWCFAYVDTEIRNDKEFMLKAISKNSSCIGYSSNELLNDLEFMKEVIKINPRCINFASRRLKNNANFMLEALKKDLWCMDYLGEELKKDKNFILQAIEKTDFRCMSFDTAYYRNNKEFMLKAIEKDFRCYLYGNNEIKLDEEIRKKLKESMRNSNRI